MNDIGLFIVFSTLMGLIFGSFANVVILRAFTGESIILPPSKCCSCKSELKWFHNIPILSYLFLRGECWFCSAKISPQYPLVELAMGLLFGLTAYGFGCYLNTVFLWMFIFFLVVITVTDIKEQVVFTEHTYFLMAAGLIYNFFDIGNSQLGQNLFLLEKLHIGINNSFLTAIGGLIAGFLIFEGLVFIIKMFIKKRAFGEGDGYIAGALGAIFGLKWLLVIFALSLFVGGLAAVPMVLVQFYKRKDYKIIGGFLVFALCACVFAFFGENLFKIHFAGYFTLLTLFLASALFICIKLLISVRDGMNLNTIPYGPALTIAAVLVLFLKNSFVF